MPRFKPFVGNANSGRRPVKSMFEEFADPEKDPPIYSLKEWHKTFLELRDPTEVKAALELLGSWKQWELMKRDWPFFGRTVDDWQAELSDLLKADAFQKILELTQAKAQSVALSACKYIANNEFDRKGGVGRPNSAEKKRADEELLRRKMDTNDDWERIQELKVVK